MSDILNGLNENQKKAVETTEGYVRVVAGPGSGKTRVLTTRYLYLTEEVGVPEENVLCITFTNKATREMKERIEKAKNGKLNSGLIMTYHKFCLSVLRGNMSFFHYPKSINILDTEYQKQLLKEVYKELGIKPKNNSYIPTLSKISKIKSANVEDVVDFLSNPNSDKLDDIKFDVKDEEFESIFKTYLKIQRKSYYLDYDDIIYFTYILLSRNEKLLSYYQNKIQYLMIDEFQDSDKYCIDIALMLTAKNKNLFIVGDDDQSIYSWRGAYPQFFVDFNRKVDACTDVVLDTNYRSTKKIVNTSNTLIKNNKVRVGKDMVTPNEEGENIVYYHADTDYNEASWVARKVNELINNGSKLDDIAILYRSNYQSRSIEEGLLKEKVAYSIWGGTRFFERMEIKDVVSYLKLINNVDDDLAFKRIINVPKRKMGDKKIEFLNEVAEREGISLYEALKESVDDKALKTVKKNVEEFIQIIEHCRDAELSPSNMMTYMLDKTGYEKQLRLDCEEDRLENLAELIKFTRDFEMSEDTEEGSLDEYLEYIALYTNKEDEESVEGSIKLLTMHTSKGLEFNHVFVVGLNDLVIPNARSIYEKGEEGLEEERRLMYVAITRAKKELYLSDAGGFSYDGKEKETSRFIQELGEDNITKIGCKLKTNKSSSIKRPVQNFMSNRVVTGFKEGDLVIHKIFGEGKVSQVDNINQVYVIDFDNERLKDSRIISMKYAGISPA